MAPQQPEFPITRYLIAGLRTFFYSQLFVTPSYPELVCRPNRHRHWVEYRSRPRSRAPFLSSQLLTSNPRRPHSHKRANRKGGNHWVVTEGYEQAVQVNVLNTFSLALSLLPKLNETKEAFPESQPYLAIVSSEAHRLANSEINAPDLYAKLNEREAFSQQTRYQVTKLIEVLFTRELIARLKSKTASAPFVIINIVNPGFCFSNLDRSGSEPPQIVRIMRRILDRTTEVGGRTLVLAAAARASSHGEFQSDGANRDVESWIYSDIGRRAQEKVFDQTTKVLEARKPGLAPGIGL